MEEAQEEESRSRMNEWVSEKKIDILDQEVQGIQQREQQ